MGWYFSFMPRKPPNATTANRMLLDCLSRITSSIEPILVPEVSLTLVPSTFLARMALVCPLTVAILISSHHVYCLGRVSAPPTPRYRQRAASRVGQHR